MAIVVSLLLSLLCSTPEGIEAAITHDLSPAAWLALMCSTPEGIEAAITASDLKIGQGQIAECSTPEGIEAAITLPQDEHRV